MLNPLLIDPKPHIVSQEKRPVYSKKEIAEIVPDLQRQMWKIKSDIFPNEVKVDPLEILDPAIALSCIGYEVRESESLGQHTDAGNRYEVAGILDTSNNHVQISRYFPLEYRNFTLAHELGHVILHQESGLHRDRALDDSSNTIPRNSTETEADIFAAYFLLPEKQVRKAFHNIFLTQHFLLNDATAFALKSKSLATLRNQYRTLRDLTRILASTERYNNIQVRSLANQFKVSTEAMAIRIEELGLAEL